MSVTRGRRLRRTSGTRVDREHEAIGRAFFLFQCRCFCKGTISTKSTLRELSKLVSVDELLLVSQMDPKTMQNPQSRVSIVANVWTGRKPPAGTSHCLADRDRELREFFNCATPLVIMLSLYMFQFTMLFTS